MMKRPIEQLLQLVPYPEASMKTAFAGALTARSAEKRDPHSAVLALEHPQAKLALFGHGSDVLVPKGDAPKPFVAASALTHIKMLPDTLLLLGLDCEGAPVLVARADLAPDETPVGFAPQGLRALYMADQISASDLSNLGYAHALLSWNQNTRFCGRCGAPTAPTDGGTKRICEGCKAEHFPRSDPVAIMLITHEDQCLLGRTPNFAAGMYSCLAGFIEHGETLEAAVRREILEEAGVVVGKVAYYASQPWPFPHSLMLGCIGQALDPSITIDHEEMEDCAWFTRADVRAMLAATHPLGKTIPPGGAIATHLIKAWLNNALGA